MMDELCDGMLSGWVSLIVSMTAPLGELLQIGHPAVERWRLSDRDRVDGVVAVKTDREIPPGKLFLSVPVVAHVLLPNVVFVTEKLEAVLRSTECLRNLAGLAAATESIPLTQVQ